MFTSEYVADHMFDVSVAQLDVVANFNTVVRFVFLYLQRDMATDGSRRRAKVRAKKMKCENLTRRSTHRRKRKKRQIEEENFHTDRLCFRVQTAFAFVLRIRFAAPDSWMRSNIVIVRRSAQLQVSRQTSRTGVHLRVVRHRFQIARKHEYLAHLAVQVGLKLRQNVGKFADELVAFGDRHRFLWYFRPELVDSFERTPLQKIALDDEFLEQVRTDLRDVRSTLCFRHHAADVHLQVHGFNVKLIDDDWLRIVGIMFAYELLGAQPERAHARTLRISTK